MVDALADKSVRLPDAEGLGFDQDLVRTRLWNRGFAHLEHIGAAGHAQQNGFQAMTPICSMDSAPLPCAQAQQSPVGVVCAEGTRALIPAPGFRDIRLNVAQMVRQLCGVVGAC